MVSVIRFSAAAEALAVVLTLSLPATAFAQQDSTKARKDTTTSVTFGGFVDTYYAKQFGRNSVGDIPFLTQPVRNREFNINLVYVDARVSAPRWRGRLAFQAGTSVQANYSAEPVI